MKAYKSSAILYYSLNHRALLLIKKMSHWDGLSSPTPVLPLQSVLLLLLLPSISPPGTSFQTSFRISWKLCFEPIFCFLRKHLLKSTLLTVLCCLFVGSGSQALCLSSIAFHSRSLPNFHFSLLFIIQFYYNNSTR